MAGRNAFQIKDDKAMLLFLIEELEAGNPDALNPRGYAIWKKAERERISNHSWQSMNSRMRKIVLPNLELQPITRVQKKFLRNKLNLKPSDEELEELKELNKIKDEKNLQGIEQEEIDSEESNNIDDDDGFDDDDDKSPSDNNEKIVKYLPSLKRKRFTNDADEKMLEFLAEEIRKHRASCDTPFGLKLWERAFRLKITKHTAQAMQSRFVRVLYPNLNDLDYISEELKDFLKRRLVSKQSNSNAFTYYHSPVKLDSPEKPGPSKRKTADAEDFEEAIEIAEKGGEFTNGVQFKAAVCQHVQRKIFKSLKEVDDFCDKTRLIEALAKHYEISLEEILHLLKSCNGKLKSVEENLRRKKLTASS